MRFKIFIGYGLKISLVFSFLLLGAYPLFAARTVTISDTLDHHLFQYDEIEYLEDNGFSISQISSDAFNEKFILNQLFVPHNFKWNKAYWARIKIKSNPDSRKKWILEFYDQTTDDIEVYIPDGKGGFNLFRSGDKNVFGQRLFKHKNFEFEFPNNTEGEQYYYFKVYSPNSQANILIDLRSIEYFIFYSLNEYFLFGSFYGMIAIIILYNFLMYLAVKERQYVYYILYLLSVGIYFMCLDGIAFQFLWPNNPVWNQIAVGYALFLVIVFSLLFAKEFLHTRAKFPVLNKILNIALVVRTVLFFVFTIFSPHLSQYKWIDIFFLLLVFSCGFYAWWNGYKPSRFFVLAYGFLFTGFLIRVLLNLNLGIVPNGIFFHYSINISFLCEMLLLSFALGDKVRIIKNARDRALKKIIKQHEVNEQLKDKVNRELEGEVVKRTKEINEQKLLIESQNQELVKQAEEIKKMNAMLDKDNYKLKHSIKEKMMERATHKNMEYHEFKVIFPDELACLRYLEDEKWNNGFSCKKCNNDKYISGKGKLDRRCSRCGYNESPTAFTIFHGVKFPLEKAFYILHLIITERDDLTLDELSSILELRKNTCGSFKRKVINLIQQNGWSKDYMEDWQNVIFYTDQEEKSSLKG